MAENEIPEPPDWSDARTFFLEPDLWHEPYELDASAIITPTETGYTTKVVSKYRPKAAIVAYAANERTARHLNLRWGVYAVKGQFWDNVNDMTNAATMAAQRYNYVKSGDVTIITSGITTGKGNTNSIRVYTMDLPVD